MTEEKHKRHIYPIWKEGMKNQAGQKVVMGCWEQTTTAGKTKAANGRQETSRRKQSVKDGAAKGQKDAFCVVLVEEFSC